VVISVIAVLMAILLPALKRAREHGRRVACLGNLRQMQMAWRMYADDQDDYIVNGQPVYGDLNQGVPWLVGERPTSYLTFPETEAEADGLMRTGALAQYVGDIRVYRCPARYRNITMLPYDKGLLSSYCIVGSMNCFPPEMWQDNPRYLAVRPRLGRTVMFVRRTGELTNPAPGLRMVFLDEGLGTALWPTWSGWSGWPSDPGHPWWDRGMPIHHSDGTCMSFADGHVEYWKWKDPATILMANLWLDQIRAGATPMLADISLPSPPEEYKYFWRAIWGTDYAL
jgi:prepilin-type processing-associated H-X9-DG protein